MKKSLLVKKIDALIRLFLYILIFWLPYSPAVIESCVIIAFILWVLKRSILLSREKGDFKALKSVRLESTFLNKPIAFFVFACVLSVTGSAFWGQSLHNFFTKTLEWFVVYFLVVESFKSKKHIYIAFAILVFTAFSTAIDGLIQFYVTHKDIFLGNVIKPGGRATAGFKTSNSLGGYLTLVIPALLAWSLLIKQKIRYRLAALLISAFMIWSLIVTFSRGAWIGAFLGAQVLMCFIVFPRKRAGFYFSSGIFFGAVFLFVSFFLILANSPDRPLLGRYETIQWRLGLWRVGLEMIKDKPLFGHGINTFMKVFQVYRGNFTMDPTYAHNCYIQLAAETGILGLLSFLWIMVKAFHESLKRIEFAFLRSPYLGAMIAGLLSGIFAFLVHSFFDTNFYSLQLSVYLWFMVGMLAAICKMCDETVCEEENVV